MSCLKVVISIVILYSVIRFGSVGSLSLFVGLATMISRLIKKSILYLVVTRSKNSLTILSSVIGY